MGYSEDRGILDGSESLYVISANPVASCLIEIGFIDNAYDYDYISTPRGKKEIAKAIANAIVLQSVN